MIIIMVMPYVWVRERPHCKVHKWIFFFLLDSQGENIGTEWTM